MRAIKYINLAISVLFIATFFMLSPKLSTNLLSLLPQSEETEILKIYEKFDNSKEIYVASKSLKTIKEFEKQVLKHNFISIKKSFYANAKYRKFAQQYQFYLKDIDTKNIQNIKENLQKSYDNLLSNPYYNRVNTTDPLEFFSIEKQDSPLSFKNAHLYIKDYGYMSVFSFDANIEAKKVYDVFMANEKEDIKIFSPFFYYVENSAAIKSQVNLLVYLAVGILLILYIVVLRNLSLLVNTLLTLFNASLLALIVVSLIWQEVSIFVMVFGIAISTIGVDYMFHHYFSGYYKRKKGFNKAVFFGFLSTFLAFFIISFVDFTFIRQLAVYSLFSLSFSYLFFAFVFSKIGFTCKLTDKTLFNFEVIKNYKYFVLILVVIISFSLLSVKMDVDIKNLDYQNLKLKERENFFKEKLQSEDKILFLLQAKSIEELIDKSVEFKSLHVNSIVPLANLINQDKFIKREEVLKAIDFEKLMIELNKSADEIGFRKGFFSDSYPKSFLYPKEPKYDLKTLKEFGFDVLYDEKNYYSYGFVQKDEEVKGVYLVNSAKLFEKSLKSTYKQLAMCGAIIIFSIFVILYISARKDFFKALSYILFPIAISLSIISFNEVNILQVFMLFIIMALSIDYGIYVSQKELNDSSKKAILFSLLSTFAGFGVLVFSSVGVLFYIGEVASMGLLAIFGLLILGKNR